MHITYRLVDGSTESLYHLDEESDLILRKGIPLLKSLRIVDISTLMGAKSNVRHCAKAGHGASDATYMYSAVHPTELQDLEDLSGDSSNSPQEPR